MPDMSDAVVAVCIVARGYGGAVHGDDCNGYVDIKFPTAGKAAVFCADMLTPDGTLKRAMCVAADLRNFVLHRVIDKPIRSLFEPVTVTVRPNVRYPWGK